MDSELNPRCWIGRMDLTCNSQKDMPGPVIVLGLQWLSSMD